MLDGVNFKKLKSVLEPSAGKGDIATAVLKKFNLYKSKYHSENLDIDVIEIDEKLRHILKGENFRVVHDDFLTFNTYKKYDLIILNPPFSNGDKHLLKALDMQKSGGQVVCLLNAETIKNPHSNAKKDLLRKLEEYNAEIEFLEEAFAEAERKTMVEVALIKVRIPKMKNSVLLDNLRAEENIHITKEMNLDDTELSTTDFLEQIVEKYNFEVKAGVQLINEFQLMSPYILTSFKEDSYKNSILTLNINGDNLSSTTNSKINSFIESVRYKYWYTLFQSDQFNKLFTTNLRREYYEKIKELVKYDFSLYNIYQLQEDISRLMNQSVEDTIINLFEEFSHKHHWHPQTGNNIHYFNGWKTNKSWKINKKVIIPLNAFSTWNQSFECGYKVKEKLNDIEKALSYLDRGIINDSNLEENLANAKRTGTTKKIQLKYFMVTFFKKGTCHIEFTNEELLARFNLYGSRKKGWLPPSYGNKQYKDMTTEEQIVIDDYQGKTEYEKVLKNKEVYLYDGPNFNITNQEALALIG
ncbi:DUF4942 domain-containing protein [Bacillus mexicanus]|uniref:class I SAM-dependent methyltransferase n=1 Tax=Bacillus mexicanus TaxID=2834415 RepID=UPI003D1DAAD0